MTVGGWIFLVMAWGAISLLMIYSYVKVLKKNNNNDGKHYKMTDQDDFKKT